MGYGIVPYAVALEEITPVLGSRDGRLHERLRQNHWHALHDQSGWRSELAVSLDAALGHLIAGEACDRNHWFQYVIAAELLCKEFGTHLANSEWSACLRLSMWVEEVDTALAHAGVAAQVFRVAGRLMDRGLPPPFPEIKILDYPTVGYLLYSELRPVQRALTAVERTKFREEGVRESVEQLAEWVEQCLESDRDLVCFAG